MNPERILGFGLLLVTTGFCIVLWNPPLDWVTTNGIRLALAGVMAMVIGLNVAIWTKE